MPPLRAAVVPLAAFLAIGAMARASTPYVPTGPVTASVYWEGQRVATGERFKPYGMTAAHKTLPLCREAQAEAGTCPSGSIVKITHVKTGRWVVVRVDDRGPFIAGREIDLSLGAANALGVSGLPKVRIEVVN